jgi:dihydrolipoamide dehydrogenase
MVAGKSDMSRKTKKILILGGGPGGYFAAIKASQLGARVSLIEAGPIGGTCLNEGCIPTKALLQAASCIRQIQKGPFYGIETGAAKIDFKKLMARKEKTIQSLVQGVEGLLRQNGVEVIRGYGRLASDHEIEVEDREGRRNRLSADRIILAAGSKAVSPPIPGLELPGVIGSREALSIDALPERLLIIGGGYIGLEFASIYSAFGTKVTLVEMESRILPMEDAEAAGLLQDALAAQDIEIITGAAVKKVGPVDSRLQAEFHTGGPAPRTADKILVAAGRAPRLESSVFAEVDLRRSEKGVAVSERMETSVPGIYAIGDMVGGYLLAHVAFEEGAVAVENALGGDAVMDSAAVPRGVFTFPEMAAVGMSEEEAKKRYSQVGVGRFSFRHNGRALIEDEQKGMVKVVTGPTHGEILGIHIVGAHATELVAEAAAIMSLEGTIEDLQAVIHNHPTLSEALGEAALDVSEMAVHAPSHRQRAKNLQ